MNSHARYHSHVSSDYIDVNGNMDIIHTAGVEPRFHDPLGSSGSHHSTTSHDSSVTVPLSPGFWIRHRCLRSSDLEMEE